MRRLADHTLFIALAVVMSLCLVAIAAGQTVEDGGATRTLTAAEEARVRQAVIASVRARMGSTVDVTVREMRIRTTGDLPMKLAAVPDIGAQTGGPVRFMVFEDAPVASASAASVKANAKVNAKTSVTAVPHTRRVGSVDAQIFVTATQLKARADIARGALVTADDVELATDDIGRQPLKALPPLVRVVGAKTIRDIAAGETIASAMLVMPPLVQSGEEVKTRVRIGELEARGIAVAAQSGALGDEITLVNAESRRRLRGRVIGEREVEVLH